MKHLGNGQNCLNNSLGEKAFTMGHIADNAESVEGADEKIRVVFA